MFYGSQDDITVLNNVKSTQGYSDVIVDDGGHTINQQITSFTQLVLKVKSGGIYVIEDLLTSYMLANDAGYLRKSTTIEFIKKIIENVQTASLENSSTPTLCIITRIYGPQISYFPIFALAFLHTGLDNIRIYVVNTDRRTDIRQLKQTINFLNKFVSRRDYITLLELGVPPLKNEYGYVMTDRALSYLYNQTNNLSSSCQYIVVTNGDNFYSQIFGKRILPHMKDGKDIIAWDFVSHHSKPQYREIIFQTKHAAPQIIDDGTGKCTPVALKAGSADLGAIAYRLEFLKERNLYFKRSDGSYSSNTDGYFIEQAALRTPASVILKQTLFFHQ